MKTLRIKPAEGRVVRDPVQGDDLPANGRRVPMTSYWRRCLTHGDVIALGERDAARGKAVKPPKAQNGDDA